MTSLKSSFLNCFFYMHDVTLINIMREPTVITDLISIVLYNVSYQIKIIKVSSCLPQYGETLNHLEETRKMRLSSFQLCLQKQETYIQ